jgi:hypothetical protein
MRCERCSARPVQIVRPARVPGRTQAACRGVTGIVDIGWGTRTRQRALISGWAVSSHEVPEALRFSSARPYFAP